MNDIVELRQYALRPGRRDLLIELFEREFVESQEAVGMDVIGTFCDADDADRFVWLRGFPDMESRADSLAAFYGGPVWKAHREVANATMIDSDNVLLLRPAWAGSGFAVEGTRAPRGTTTSPDGFVVANVYTFETAVPEALIDTFRRTVPVQCAAAGAKFLASFVREESPNTFPALPVREGEHVFIWFALFADAGAAREVALSADVRRTLSKPPEALRLLPTVRSRLHA